MSDYISQTITVSSCQSTPPGGGGGWHKAMQSCGSSGSRRRQSPSRRARPSPTRPSFAEALLDSKIHQSRCAGPPFLCLRRWRVLAPTPLKDPRGSGLQCGGGARCHGGAPRRSPRAVRHACLLFTLWGWGGGGGVGVRGRKDRQQGPYPSEDHVHRRHRVALGLEEHARPGPDHVADRCSGPLGLVLSVK